MRKIVALVLLVVVSMAVKMATAAPVQQELGAATNVAAVEAVAQVCFGQDCLLGSNGLTGTNVGSLAGAVDLRSGEFGNATTLPSPEVDGSINVSFGGNVDPSQSLVFGAVDAGTPSDFAAALTAPLMPNLTGLVQVEVELSASCADAGNDGCGFGPFLSLPADFNAQYFVNGFAIPLTGFELGTASSVPAPGPGAFDFGTLTGTFDCGAGCTSFETVISFRGSGGLDAISFTSSYVLTQLTPVPEPSSLTLIGLGLLGLGFTMWRRRS